jgi:16S rRNA processing protein RimM
VVEAGLQVGQIVDVSHLPSQDLLVIELEDETEMLLPFVEQFVPVVNLAEGFIEITPPEGLLEEPDAD